MENLKICFIPHLDYYVFVHKNLPHFIFLLKNAFWKPIGPRTTELFLIDFQCQSC